MNDNINKARLAIWTAQRVRGHVGHADLTLDTFDFDFNGVYRATYVDNRDISTAGVAARWEVSAAPGLGIISIRHQAPGPGSQRHRVR